MKRILCAVRATVFLVLSAAPAFAQFETATSSAPFATLQCCRPRCDSHADQHRHRRGETRTTDRATTSFSPYARHLSDDGREGRLCHGDGRKHHRQVGSRMRVDAQMDVGQVSERIQVTGTAPRIETDTSAARPDHHGRSNARAAAQRPRIFFLALLTTGVRPRRSTTGGHAARRRVQRERAPQHLQ